MTVLAHLLMLRELLSPDPFAVNRSAQRDRVIS